ncbi:Gag-Pol polyprotein [Plecturocebus cupreus]
MQEIQAPVHPFKPGDSVWVKKWNPTTSGPPWDGPHIVMLSTRAAVKVAGIGPWMHHSRLKPAAAQEKWARIQLGACTYNQTIYSVCDPGNDQLYMCYDPKLEPGTWFETTFTWTTWPNKVYDNTGCDIYYYRPNPDCQHPTCLETYY